MINWPAVIKCDGDDELIYVGGEEAWRRDARSYLYHHGGADQLIDSSGQVFDLDRKDDGSIEARGYGKMIDLDSFIRLVRIHASSAHHCCIEKISFRSVGEGIDIIAGMEEQNS